MGLVPFKRIKSPELSQALSGMGGCNNEVTSPGEPSSRIQAGGGGESQPVGTLILDV